MSILAQMAGGMGEPGATQALAYLLNTQAGLLQAFVKSLGAVGITFDPRHRVESERGDDGGRIPGRPDLKIRDAGGNLRVLVENKFWTGLTEAQPVDYLKMLPEDVNSGILFIVPRQRVTTFWNVLRAQCLPAGLDVPMEPEVAGRVTWSQVAGRLMLVTDWQHVVDILEVAADRPEIRSDINQFRRLVERLENVEAFPALRPDEVTNVDLARRVIAYAGLIDSICGELHEKNIALWGNGNSYSIPPAVYRNLQLINRGNDWAALLL